MSADRVTVCAPHIEKWYRSDDTAYLIGAVMGDGYLTNSRFGFASIDREFVEEVNRILSGMGARLRIHKRHQHKEHNPTFHIEFTNHDFCRLLMNETSCKRKIPQWILRDDKYIIAFANGVLDAEGCVGKAKTYYNKLGCGYRYTVIITSADAWMNKLIKEMKRIGLSVNKRYKMKKMKRHHKQAYQWSFNVSSFISSPFDFLIQRKKERLNEYLKYKTIQDSSFYSECGKRGAMRRWSKEADENGESYEKNLCQSRAKPEREGVETMRSLPSHSG
jgi:intein/homing endonuclease